MSDAADDRAKRLAAWKEQKEQKDQKHRGSNKPSASTTRGKAAAKEVGKETIKERGKDGDRRKDEMGGARRSSRESPSKKCSPAADEACIQASVQPKAMPLLERLVRDGQSCGALPGGMPGTPTFASFGGATTDPSNVPSSPSFPSFASFASRSAINPSNPSATPPSKTPPSTSDTQQSTSTPLKFAVFGASASDPAATPMSSQPAATPSSTRRTRPGLLSVPVSASLLFSLHTGVALSTLFWLAPFSRSTLLTAFLCRAHSTRGLSTEQGTDNE